MTRIKVALNGGRLGAGIPTTPHEIAAATRAAIAAGAFAVHIHPRDREGRESLAPDDVDAVVAACGQSIGVTTGAWIADRRLDLIRRWTRLPAFASVNMNEDGALAVAELLLSRGVEIEAGLATRDAAETFMRSPMPNRAIRILFEPQEQSLEEALANVEAMSAIVKRCTLPRVLHGVDATAWPLIAEAARRGWDARVGLEDTLQLPDGSPAVDNVRLLAAARDVIRRSSDG